MWFLIALGVVVAGLALRDLLRRPDPTAKPRPDHGRHTADGWRTGETRGWDGVRGGGNSPSNGGGSPL